MALLERIADCFGLSTELTLWLLAVPASFLLVFLFTLAQRAWLRRRIRDMVGSFPQVSDEWGSRVFPAQRFRTVIGGRDVWVRAELDRGGHSVGIVVPARVPFARAAVGRGFLGGRMNRWLNGGGPLPRPLDGYFWFGPARQDPTDRLMEPDAVGPLRSLFEERGAQRVHFENEHIEAWFAGRPRKLLRRDWPALAGLAVELARAVEAPGGETGSSSHISL